jgi:hypothetical protein
LYYSSPPSADGGRIPHAHGWRFRANNRGWSSPGPSAAVDREVEQRGLGSSRRRRPAGRRRRSSRRNPSGRRTPPPRAGSEQCSSAGQIQRAPAISYRFLAPAPPTFPAQDPDTSLQPPPHTRLGIRVPTADLFLPSRAACERRGSWSWSRGPRPRAAQDFW